MSQNLPESNQPVASVGSEFSFEFVVSQKDMDMFWEISGDRNPLHHDSNYAHTQGFKGPVVYGGILVSKISKLIGMHLPGANCIWTGLTTQFTNPLFIDESATLSAKIINHSDATGMVEIKIQIRTSDRKILSAKAEALIQKQP